MSIFNFWLANDGLKVFFQRHTHKTLFILWTQTDDRRRFYFLHSGWRMGFDVFVAHKFWWMRGLIHRRRSRSHFLFLFGLARCFPKMLSLFRLFLPWVDAVQDHINWSNLLRHIWLSHFIAAYTRWLYALVLIIFFVTYICKFLYICIYTYI